MTFFTYVLCYQIFIEKKTVCVVDGFDDGSKDPPSTCYQLRETYQSEREEHIVFLIKYP